MQLDEISENMKSGGCMRMKRRSEVGGLADIHPH